MVAGVELDPWGGDTSRSWNQYYQPKLFASYTRDVNESDEAMMRRYNRWWSRFDQPDPYDGSYNLSNPQTFNRYSYTQDDPVNFVDPSGLIPIRLYYTTCSTEADENGNPIPGTTQCKQNSILVDIGFDTWGAPFHPSSEPRDHGIPGGVDRAGAPQTPTGSTNAEQQQQGFDDCAKSHIREFRKAERGAIAKISIGTVATVLAGEVGESAAAANAAVDGAVARAGARVVAYGSRYRLGQFLAGGSKLAEAATGTMVIDGFKNSFANNAQVDKALADCAAQWPLANHSTFWHFVSNPF